MTCENKVVEESYITISQKTYNRKIRFDYYWKMSLIIILIVAMVYMFWEFRNINKEGLACKSSPFVWGQEKAKEQGVYCYYDCSNDKRTEINLSNIP